MAERVPSEYLVGFVLVTALFSLWGFANDVTHPMVAAFKTILLLNNTQSTLVMTAFYGGYCFMAIPAALVIKRFTYKTGILLGLLLYSLGCLLFIPAASRVPATPGQAESTFAVFLFAYFVMTCGLSFLETTANPYILSMGSEESATPRLNLAQAFNPLGSLCGMFVAKTFVLAGLDPATDADRERFLHEDPNKYRIVTAEDLGTIRTPYALLGALVAVFFIAFLFAKLPQTESQDRTVDLCGTLRRVAVNTTYVKSVFAQMFNIGAQTCCWTFIIQYGSLELGLSKSAGEGYNIIAMVIFVSNRFVCTYLLRFLRAGTLLGVAGLTGAVLCFGTIMLPGYVGLASLIAASACISPLFPTIYGIALEGLGDDAKLASAGLIVAIGGGAVIPPIQGWVIDSLGVRTSFAVPLICFLFVAAFGFDTMWRHRAARDHIEKEVDLESSEKNTEKQAGKQVKEEDVETNTER